MKLKKCIYPVILLILLISAAGYPAGGGSGGDEPDSSTLRFTFTERLRFVSLGNAISLESSGGSDAVFTRHLTSVAMEWLPKKSFDLKLQLTNEFRYYFEPDNRDFTFNEVFVENLYAKWKLDGSLPVVLTLGRQNIMLGEGFVVMDGHPLDGSRSIYFNAVRSDIFFTEKRKLTLFYTYQPETDDLLPVANDHEQKLVEQPEEGLGAYLDLSYDSLKIEPYLIQKRVDSNELYPEESRIRTLGARVSLKLSSTLSFTIEGAMQEGEKGDADRSAWGGYAHLDLKPGSSRTHPGVFTIGALYLSGDDPATKEWEGWDPIFSRWPKWSESYIYTLIRENGGRVAYWNNLSSLYGSFTVPVTKYTKLKLTWHHLMAPQAPNGVDPFPGGTGKTRGNLYIARWDAKVGKHLTGHLIWEHFDRGDFYHESADGYNWVRFELRARF